MLQPVEGAGDGAPAELPASDALWVRVDDAAGAEALADQVIAAVEHMLQPHLDVVRDVQVL